MRASYIPTEIRRLVAERGALQCEYCLLPAGVAFFPHEVDHVVAVKHGGLAVEGNLAFACWRCNRYKGTDLGSYDPQTGGFSLLFKENCLASSPSKTTDLSLGGGFPLSGRKRSISLILIFVYFRKLSCEFVEERAFFRGSITAPNRFLVSGSNRRLPRSCRRMDDRDDDY